MCSCTQVLPLKSIVHEQLANADSADESPANDLQVRAGVKLDERNSGVILDSFGCPLIAKQEVLDLQNVVFGDIYKQV